MAGAGVGGVGALASTDDLATDGLADGSGAGCDGVVATGMRGTLGASSR